MSHILSPLSRFPHSFLCVILLCLQHFLECFVRNVQPVQPLLEVLHRLDLVYLYFYMFEEFILMLADDSVEIRLNESSKSI